MPSLSQMMVSVLFLLWAYSASAQPSGLRVRKEWSALTPDDRNSYISAVKCLMKLPSALPPFYNSPSHFDDFLAVHINHTWQVHMNGLFLGWHRGFVRLYEDALQTKCGYKGMQPYWDFTKPFMTNPLFDGSPTSMGGNGSTTSDGNVGSETEGGCLTSGPFANRSIPFRTYNIDEAFTGSPPRRAWTPASRCLSRNFDPAHAARLLNQRRVNDALDAPDITTFRGLFDPIVVGRNGDGLHAGGHAAIGGTMLQLFTAPGDPMFYLLHCQLDRLWDTWQRRNPKERIMLGGKDLVSGTKTALDTPQSAAATPDDVLSFGYMSALGKDRTVSEALDTSAAWLGYQYG